jgi:DNA mismatch repair protein MutS2
MGFSVSERVLEMLDWGTLEDALAAETVTAGGRRLATSRQWAADDEIEARLDEVSEARSLLEAGRDPFHGGPHALDPHLAQASKGKILGGVELLTVGEALRGARLTRQALSRQRLRAPRLGSLAEALPDLSDLERALLRSLDSRGRLLDDASPELAEARREVHQLTSRIQKQMAAALTSSALAPHLQDQFYTLRAERYVLPIKIEARSRVRGIVHDVSASGTTVFVEPEEVVDLNNRLRYAELAEEREALRVLTALTGRVADALEAIRGTIGTMSRIDLVMARARLADRLGACRPRVVPEARLALRTARHPLLALRGDAVVPNDIVLGGEIRALILSGPNAGGKTVALKTVGLAVLMTRAGIHLPAGEGSVVGRFGRVHADIGDDQSLAESLSTFSGQIAQMVRFLEGSDAHTLVLLDEIIVGTDPTEGAALAQAILERLVDRGACLLVTTHYPLLKELAAQDPRFENTSMEIDPKTHRLTYRMIAGLPGRSGALEIADRLGLDTGVVGRARALLGSDRRELEQRLRRLDDLRLALDTEKREAQHTRAESEEAKRRWVGKLREIEQAREQVSREMKVALDAEIRRAHREIASVIRDLQRKGTARQAGEARKRIVRLEDRLEARMPPPAPPQPETDWSRVSPGARVRLRRLGADAELITGPNAAGQVQVLVGGKRMWIPGAEVAPAPPREDAGSPPRAPAPPARPSPRDDAPETRANTLDVRGLRAEEAESRLIYFLDRLYAEGEATAYLIHGHGTGALKSRLRAYLAESPYVSDFRAGDPHRGGDGVTVIKLEE